MTPEDVEEVAAGLLSEFPWKDARELCEVAEERHRGKPGVGLLVGVLEVARPYPLCDCGEILGTPFERQQRICVGCNDSQV